MTREEAAVLKAAVAYVREDRKSREEAMTREEAASEAREQFRQIAAVRGMHQIEPVCGCSQCRDLMILTVTTRISRKWLERKSKAELASIILANIDKIDLFADESILKCEIEREALNADDQHYDNDDEDDAEAPC